MILSSRDRSVCRALAKRHGTSYFLASRLFPRSLREATWVLYAFFRLPDEYVDRPGVRDPEEALQQFEERWREVFAGAEVQGDDEESCVLRAAKEVFFTFHIPFSYSEDFLRAMKQDVTVSRYPTYQDLENYMHGSAVVVGYMMCCLIGVRGPEALPAARALGEAMQLTNFLRDVGEDWRERGRIYLPLEDLRRFGVSEEDIAEGRVTEGWCQLMQFEIARARALYEKAQTGIPSLAPKGRLPVALAGSLYAGILREIERGGYDVFSQRARTSHIQKVHLALSTIFTHTIRV